MYRLLISDEARLDIVEAFLWYEDQREGLGLDFELCLEAGLNQVLKSPFSFEERYQNIRVYFISRFPYGIYYLIENNSIKVFAIFHTSRNPINWNKRFH